MDGEAIIINLEKGNYYSMNEAGSMVWERIAAKYPVSAIIKFLSERYESEPGKIEKSVTGLLEMLKSDGLINETLHPANPPEDATSPEKKPFLEPKIEKYEDMQEMLLADPVHDVDEMGWPRLKQK